MSEIRKPVFTEEDFKDMQQRFPTAGSEFAYGARFMMLHYEHLITTGKLRVVEEVELVPPIWNCSGKGCGWDGERPGPYCPGCGNNIKR